MRYLLDGRSLQDASAMRGIGTYLRGLLNGFETAGVIDHVGLLLEREAGPRHVITSAGPSIHPYRLRPLNRHARPLLDPFQVSRALRSEPPTLYHAIEYGQPILPNVPVVLTVHDLIPFVLPDLYPWMRRERALALRQFRHADAVIAVSGSTSADAQRIAGVDPKRVTVIPEGVRPFKPRTEAELVAVRRALNLPARFLLAVGTFDPRKRVAMLTEIVSRVRAHHDVGLVIAGFQGNFAAAVDAAARGARIDGVTRVLGHVSDSDLWALYQLTECLVFTSSYEGFGLPPLEAMAAGAPVAAFDNSSLGEVVGEAGVLVADGDVLAMADAVSTLVADSDERRRRVDLGRKRASEFSWERTAAQTLAVYSTVLAAR